MCYLYVLLLLCAQIIQTWGCECKDKHQQTLFCESDIGKVWYYVSKYSKLDNIRGKQRAIF